MQPIEIRIVLRSLDTRALMPNSIAEEIYYNYSLQGGFGVEGGTDAAVKEARAFIDEHEDYPTFILSAAKADDAFSKTSRN